MPIRRVVSTGPLRSPRTFGATNVGLDRVPAAARRRGLQRQPLACRPSPPNPATPKDRSSSSASAASGTRAGEKPRHVRRSSRTERNSPSRCACGNGTVSRDGLIGRGRRRVAAPWLVAQLRAPGAPRRCPWRRLSWRSGRSGPPATTAPRPRRDRVHRLGPRRRSSAPLAIICASRTRAAWRSVNPGMRSRNVANDWGSRQACRIAMASGVTECRF